MKKVLFLIHDLGCGGAEKVLTNLANNLDKTKYEVTIQTLFDVGINKKYISKKVNYIGGWKKMFPGNVTLMKLFSPKFLCKLIIKEDYDIVVSFLEGPCSRIVSSYNGKKVAWIHIEHASEKTISSSFRSFKEMNDCYNSFNKIICVAETVKSNFLRLSDVKCPCEVLYNVNQTDYIIEKSLEKQDSVLHNDDCINIVSVGRLIINHKGYERLIAIHKRLLEQGVNNKLYILGEGPDHKKLQALIDALGVNETCVLLGFDDNPYKFVANADLFVCSSYKEGFSTAVTEALVLGIPVVSTEVSGAKELLGYNNEYGIVTDNNENALYEGMYKMLTKDGLLIHYKKQAEIRGKKFSADKTTKAVEKMLESL